MITLLLAILFPQGALADEIFAINRDGRAVQVRAYAEDKLFVLDEIIRAADGWPELTRHEYFTTEPQMRAVLQKDYSNRRAAVQAMESEAPVLRGASASLWPVKNAWSWEWEMRFSDWIRSEVKPDFFVRYKVATDCADVAYALRWIFARMNGLPMTSRSSTGEWITESSVRSSWMQLSTAPEWYNDRRFLSALNYILGLTYTHTLVRDAYPVAIRPGSLLEGGFQLFIHDKSGHTQPITRVIREGESGMPIEILQSTTPRIVRELMYDGYWNPFQPQKGEGGLLRFRWPLPKGRPGLVPAEQMPNFSEEQFQPDFVKADEPFFLAVFRRIQPGLSLESIVESLFNDTKKALRLRVDIVNDGYVFCQTHDCGPNSQGWEDWSTPNRDERIAQQLQQIVRLSYVLPKEKQAWLENEIKKPVLSLEGEPVSMQMLQWAWNNKIFSSEPTVEPAVRWGISPIGFASYLSTQAKAAWRERQAFIEKTPACSKCLPGSAEWQKNSAQTYDMKLITLFPLSEHYCTLASAPACATFREIAARPFDLLGKEKTLHETLKQLVTVNFDPRHSAEIRRNGRAGGFRMVLLPGMAQTFSDQKFLVARAEADFKIWDIQQEPVEIRPPFGQWVGVRLASEEAWFSGENKIGLRDLITGAETSSLLPFTASGVRTGSGPTALITSKTNWAQVRRSDLAILHSGSADSLEALDAEHLLTVNAGQVSLVNLQTDPPTVQPLTIKEEKIRAVNNTEMGWFFYNSRGVATQLLTRQGSQVIELPKFEFITLIASDGHELLGCDTKKCSLLTLNAAGETVTEKALPLPKNIGPNLIAFSENGITTTYFLRDDKFVSVQALPGEDWVEGYSGDFVVAFKNKKYILRGKSDLRVLREANLLISFVTEGKDKDLIEIGDRAGTEMDWRLWSSSARLESISRPGDFSYLTGLSPMINFFSSQTKMQRGFEISIAGSRYWVESR